jgi:hypothetical protein
MVIVLIIIQAPNSRRLFHRHEPLPFLQHHSLLICGPVPRTVDMVYARGLIPVFELEGVIIGVYPVELGWVAGDCAHEPEGFLSCGVVDIEPGKRMSVVEDTVIRVCGVKIKLWLDGQLIFKGPESAQTCLPFLCVVPRSFRAPASTQTIPLKSAVRISLPG